MTNGKEKLEARHTTMLKLGYRCVMGDAPTADEIKELVSHMQDVYYHLQVERNVNHNQNRELGDARNECEFLKRKIMNMEDEYNVH